MSQASTPIYKLAGAPPILRQSPPKPGAIAAALGPSAFQQCPPWVKRMHPWPTEFGLLAAQPASDRIACQRQIAADLLDGAGCYAGEWVMAE